MAEKVNVKIEKLPASQVKIIITVPAVEMETYINQAVEDASKTLNVAGFRKGKIPREIVERQVGKEMLIYEGAQKAIRKLYVDAILDQKIAAIGQPKVDITKIEEGKDLEFEAVVAVLPKVKLAEWESGVKKVNQKFSKEKVEVKADEIQRELDYLAKQRAKIITVNREAKMGDQLEVDFKVLVNQVPIEGGTAKKHLLVLGEGRFIPGFEEQLVGVNAGEEKNFELAFPKEYHEKTLAGKLAKFEVKVNLVQDRLVPEINDEFASSIGKFKNLEELKKNIQEGIEHEGKQKLDNKRQQEHIDALIKDMEVELPELLIKVEVERMFQELDQNVSMMGLDREKYLQQIGASEETLREQWGKKEAVNRVKATLAIREIAKQQSLEPKSEEIEERMNRHLQYYKTMKDMEKKIDMERLYEAVKGDLIHEKVFEYLTTL